MLDDEFIPVKLVISWIVDGVLMCFFHAIRGKQARPYLERCKLLIVAISFATIDKNETADNDNVS